MRLCTFISITACACGGGEASFDATWLPPDAAIDAASPDARAGDGNDSVEEALPLVVDDPDGALGFLETEGDHDFWTFEVDAPRWLRIRAPANILNREDGIDTTIRLHDAAGVLLARAADDPTRTGWDPLFYYRFEAAGRYSLEIWDRAGKGDPAFYYQLFVESVETGPGASVDAEEGDDATSAVPLTPAPIILPSWQGPSKPVAAFMGTFDHAGDRDAFAAVVPEGTELIVRAWLSADPNVGGVAPRLAVTDASGTGTLGRLTAGSVSVAPFLPPGDYRVFADRDPGDPGSGGFWVAWFQLVPEEYALEAEDPLAPGSNDAPEGAEPLAMVSGGSVAWGRVAARLSTPGDVDRFSFHLAAGQDALLRCNGLRLGSGVRGLTIVVEAPDGTAVATATEGASADASVRWVATGAGPHQLVVSKQGQDPEVDGDWVRCYVMR